MRIDAVAVSPLSEYAKSSTYSFGGSSKKVAPSIIQCRQDEGISISFKELSQSFQELWREGRNVLGSTILEFTAESKKSMSGSNMLSRRRETTSVSNLGQRFLGVARLMKRWSWSILILENTVFRRTHFI